jgi:Uma2 family endonuclease
MLTDAPARAKPLATLADVLACLHGIPATRIRLRPLPGTATERDVLDAHASQGLLCELVDGVLVEKAIGFWESRVAAVLIQLLGNFLDQHDLGIVAGPDGMTRLAPGLVRIPDVAFFSWARLPDRQVPREPIPDLVPDLAVEILSQGNTEEEMTRKIGEYCASGVRMVWLLDPTARVARACESPDRVQLLSNAAPLPVAGLLPGLSLTFGELLDRASGGRRS